MANIGEKALDVVVIGAGQAGLGVSYYLSKNDVDHVVLERGKIAESWRTQRWDSFALNTPNWMSTHPGDTYEGPLGDGFYLRNEFVNSLKAYAAKFDLPVKENSKVRSITKTDDGKYFLFEFLFDGSPVKMKARNVIIASGIMNAPRVPAKSGLLSRNIFQLHTSQYRNPARLPEGNVLVVGSGQSGCQIAEDILSAGRKVYLSTSKVGRVPRRYRGKDFLEWFLITKFLDVTTDSVKDSELLRAPQPQISGVGRFGHSVSLQYLHSLGAVILGHLENVDEDQILLAPNAAEHIRYADSFSERMKKMVDEFITLNNMDSPAAEVDIADEADQNAACAQNVTNLNLKDHNITSVIWSTGFGSDFSWIKLPVTNNEGKPLHKNGLSPVKGLSFVGFPWLRSRKSGIIFGVNEDARYITDNVISSLKA